MIAQTQQGQDFDWKRSMTFACFGAYAGAMYKVIYGPVYTSILKRGVPALGVALFDSAVTTHIVYFPVYYMVQESVQSATPSLQEAWLKCQNNRWNDFVSLLSVFTPITLANLYLVPTPWRGTFSGTVGIIWAIYLSFTRGTYTEDESESESCARVKLQGNDDSDSSPTAGMVVPLALSGGGLD